MKLLRETRLLLLLNKIQAWRGRRGLRKNIEVVLLMTIIMALIQYFLGEELVGAVIVSALSSIVWLIITNAYLKMKDKTALNNQR